MKKLKERVCRDVCLGWRYLHLDVCSSLICVLHVSCSDVLQFPYKQIFDIVYFRNITIVIVIAVFVVCLCRMILISYERLQCSDVFVFCVENGKSVENIGFIIWNTIASNRITLHKVIFY